MSGEPSSGRQKSRLTRYHLKSIMQSPPWSISLYRQCMAGATLPSGTGYKPCHGPSCFSSWLPSSWGNEHPARKASKEEGI